ncbi:MAG: Cys-tRNA(Pro) deacylase [Candidatus Enterosoma sp.]|nr:Cys-tRNA(Pro) deacylase [Bacilli bacterium]MDD6846047.1 Cys-tRNA(Pro) deacylase [bacterium]MDY3211145.1 Cys-tRNA(Pro) deacylase [Candidatus Enterosoma sp.]MDD7081892.1 Cys-tRNA(Pro) deacylase [bacterium]MDD7707355.1 Cys-tRNA(Pro) deacylase [bacterium]
MKETKTNAMRLLDLASIPYIPHEYDPEKALSAVEVAKILSQDTERVFKTLVTVGKSLEHYLFVIPGEKELDLKKAAKACGEKNIEMIPQKELLPLTGYIHGGCSPIGTKKKLKTYFDETMCLFDSVYVSGGRRGLQIEINPEDLISFCQGEYADLCK